MIAFLKGKPVSTGADYVVLEVGGIGYKVYVPTSALRNFTDKNNETTVFTYLHVREDAMQLFGFLSENDRETFEMLIQVSGVGPKVALAILSAMPCQTFIQSVLHEQINMLTQISGVGKKTAQRIIIELKDKLSKINVQLDNEVAVIPTSLENKSNDALQALITLGYNPIEAKRVLGKISTAENENLTTEDMIKFALKELGRF